MLVILRLAEPLIRDAHPAGEGDLAVDDQRLAMGAVVGLFEVQKPSGLNQTRRAAGLSAARCLGVDHRSNRIETIRTVTPRCAALERLDEAVADARRP